MIFDNAQTNTTGNAGANSEKSGNEENSANSVSASVTPTSSASGGSSIPTSFFYIAPLLGIVVLLTLGIIFLATSGGKEKEESKGRRISTEPTLQISESIAEETPTPAQTNGSTTVNTSETPTRFNARRKQFSAAPANFERTR